MRELVLHLLDISENSVTAGADNIDITIREDLVNDALEMIVKDDGKGMDEALLASVTDPFVTSRTTRRVGFGIPFLKAAAEECNGGMHIESAVGVGTTIAVKFQHSHIDRMPLGDLAGTMLTLVIGHQEIHWRLTYSKNDAEFVFDDAPIKEELEGIPLTEPGILAFVRQLLEDGVADVQNATA